MRQLREQLDEVPEPEKKRTKPEKRSDPIKSDTTPSRSRKYGLGQKVSIYWPEMKKWYKGKITHVTSMWIRTPWILPSLMRTEKN